MCFRILWFLRSPTWTQFSWDLFQRQNHKPGQFYASFISLGSRSSPSPPLFHSKTCKCHHLAQKAVFRYLTYQETRLRKLGFFFNVNTRILLHANFRTCLNIPKFYRSVLHIIYSRIWNSFILWNKWFSKLGSPNF